MGALRTKVFWYDMLERAVSTAAQAILIVSGLSSDYLDLIHQTFDFKTLATAAGLGFAFTVIKSIAATQVGNGNDASLVK